MWFGCIWFALRVLVGLLVCSLSYVLFSVVLVCGVAWAPVPVPCLLVLRAVVVSLPYCVLFCAGCGWFGVCLLLFFLSVWVCLRWVWSGWFGVVWCGFVPFGSLLALLCSLLCVVCCLVRFDMLRLLVSCRVAPLCCGAHCVFSRLWCHCCCVRVATFASCVPSFLVFSWATSPPGSPLLSLAAIILFPLPTPSHTISLSSSSSRPLGSTFVSYSPSSFLSHHHYHYYLLMGAGMKQQCHCHVFQEIRQYIIHHHPMHCIMVASEVYMRKMPAR